MWLGTRIVIGRAATVADTARGRHRESSLRVEPGEELPRDGNQTLSANGRASTVFPPKRTDAASLLDHPVIVDGVKKRPLTVSGHSVWTGSEICCSAGPGRRHVDDGDGDGSLPEDSETTWRCAPVASRLGGTAAARAEGRSHNEAVVPVRFATFPPTTHHPKVIAPLKILFLLPDVVDLPQACCIAVSGRGIAPQCLSPLPTATPVKISG
jgi:hypothetical protein